jgi:hypothetical protein
MLGVRIGKNAVNGWAAKGALVCVVSRTVSGIIS